MVIKICLVVLVVIIPTLIGLKRARKYEQREQVLRESLVLFRRVSNDIKYNLSTVPNAIEASRQDFKTILKDVLGSISTAILDNTYSDMAVTSEIGSITCLLPYDKQVITNAILSLGTTDVDSQLGILNSTIDIIQDLEKEAGAEKVKNSKLYRTIGLVTGLMFAIVVI